MARKSKEHKPVKVVKLAKAGACARGVGNWGSVKAYHRFDRSGFNPKKLLEDLPHFSPKIEKLLAKIKELDREDTKKEGKLFKHFIFTDIKGAKGLKMIAGAMVASGYHLIQEKASSTKLKLNLSKGDFSSRFGLFCSTPIFDVKISDKQKNQIKDIFNQRPENIHGEVIRFILADSGFKEGVDLYDVKYVHILEPQLTKADEIQAIGRATRMCGQKGLRFVPGVGWTLHVFEYDLYYPSKSEKKFWLFGGDREPKKTVSAQVLEMGKVNMSEIKTIAEMQDLLFDTAVDKELTKAIHKRGN